MEILGIGPTEFLFIVIILLLVLGPADLVTLGQKAGQLIRKLRTSETWVMVANLSRALRNLPNTLAEETGADEILREVVGPEKRKTARSLSLENTIDRSPDANRIQPPGADAFSSWTNPKPPAETAPAKPPAAANPSTPAPPPEPDATENK